MIPNNPPRMQSLVTISCYLIILLLASHSQDSNANEIEKWHLKIDKHNIQVYARETSSGYQEIKAVTSVKAMPSDLLSLLDNVAVADQWIDNCEKITLVDSPSANERIVHSFFYAPWPVKNRDMVTHSQTIFDQSGTVRIVIRDYTALYPANDDYVRMKNIRGEWIIQPDDAEYMTVSYEGYGEPAGNLPIWLANNLVKSSTYNTFKQMRNMLEGVDKRAE